MDTDEVRKPTKRRKFNPIVDMQKQISPSTPPQQEDIFESPNYTTHKSCRKSLNFSSISFPKNPKPLMRGLAHIYDYECPHRLMSAPLRNLKARTRDMASLYMSSQPINHYHHSRLDSQEVQRPKKKRSNPQMTCWGALVADSPPKWPGKKRSNRNVFGSRPAMAWRALMSAPLRNLKTRTRDLASLYMSSQVIIRCRQEVQRPKKKQSNQSAPKMTCWEALVADSPPKLRKKRSNRNVFVSLAWGTMFSVDIAEGTLVKDIGEPAHTKNRAKPVIGINVETTRVWKLLLEDIDSELVDERTRKAWQEEQSLFLGLVDSFIEKMRPVLGDRSFSPWKGSVLDSVVGAFLTQNVGDNISASAFMSMAATFPLKPSSNEKSSCEGEEYKSEHSRIPSFLELLGMLEQSSASLKGEKLSLMYSRITSCLQLLKMQEQAAAALKGDESIFKCCSYTELLQMQEHGKGNMHFRTEQSGLSEGSLVEETDVMDTFTPKEKEGKDEVGWDALRIQTEAKCKKDRTTSTMDMVDWEAVRCADVKDISEAIKNRGMQHMLAERIKDFLNRLIEDHGSLDLQWLRDVPPDKAKDFLLSIYGFGLKSTECVRLLTLHQAAFPVDVNVARIAVRLGWVPLQPLHESLQLHHLKLYPNPDSVQKFLWLRLYELDQRKLFELHYQMITFGKVFCTKIEPNCKSCPMRRECKHFASADVKYPHHAGLALPAPEPKPIIEELETPELEPMTDRFELTDIEDILLNKNARSIIQSNAALQESKKSRAKKRLRTEHQVYVIPDSHVLLNRFDKREKDDPNPYLLFIWSPAETLNSVRRPEICTIRESDQISYDDTCLSCNNIDNDASQTVQGTILIPCRTAMRGAFALDGTFFQVNEVFADHESSVNPINVQRDWLWELQHRTVYFGASIPSTSQGLELKAITFCFQKGFVCVTGFDCATRKTEPLIERLHPTASKSAKYRKTRRKQG